MSEDKLKEVEDYSDDESDEYEEDSDVRLRLRKDIDSRELAERLIRGDDTGNVAELFELVRLGEEVLDTENVNPTEDIPPWLDINNGDIASIEELETIMDPLVPDRGVLKKIIKAGEGPVVNPKSFVTIHYKAFLDFGDEPFDSTFTQRKPQVHRLSDNKLILGLDIALSSMKTNERAYFVVHPRYAYGKIGCPPRIPPSATILYDVSLLHWIDDGDDEVVGDISKEERNCRPFDEVLKAAIDQKQQGNSLISNAQYSAALRKFTRTFRWFEEYATHDEEEEHQKVEVLVDIRLNMALCYLRLNQPKKTCSMCIDGIELNRNGDKVYKLLFRMGQALEKMGELQQALKRYQRALELQRSAPDIAKAITDLRKKMTEEAQLEKQLMKTMLGF